MTHEEVVKSFADRKVRQKNPGKGEVQWKGCRVYCEDDNLYSYGQHFVLAKYLGTNGKHIFLKNGDKYSQSTGHHQGLTQYYCYGPTISFNALHAASIWFENLNLNNIIDWTEPERGEIYKEKDTGKYFKYKYDRINGEWKSWLEEWKEPNQGMFIPYRRAKWDGETMQYYEDFLDKEYTHIIGNWHILGGTLMEWKGEQYLSALDEMNYFISHLPYRVRTVKEAYEALKPQEIKDAEERGVEVKRQGEWFFAPFKKNDKEMAKFFAITQKFLKKYTRQEALPKRVQTNNEHVCRIFQPNDTIYARGKVYHKNLFGRLTGEHRSLKLGDEWHVAFHNTEIESWSVNGKFD